MTNKTTNALTIRSTPESAKKDTLRNSTPLDQEDNGNGKTTARLLFRHHTGRDRHLPAVQAPIRGPLCYPHLQCHLSVSGPSLHRFLHSKHDAALYCRVGSSPRPLLSLSFCGLLAQTIVLRRTNGDSLAWTHCTTWL